MSQETSSICSAAVLATQIQELRHGVDVLAGVAIEVIAKLAGHADIRTTQRYININVTRDRTVDAMGRTFGCRSPFAADLTTNQSA